jgi:hypothetical protein
MGKDAKGEKNEKIKRMLLANQIKIIVQIILFRTG